LNKLVITAAALFSSFAFQASAQPVESVLSQARKEKPALIETMKDLVSIESGSRDTEGLERISSLIADRLKALGGKVEFVLPGADVYKMEDTPPKIGRMVHARFEGTGTKKILLIAHMDTVYLKGMLAQQPFRIDGGRAYGLGNGGGQPGGGRGVRGPNRGAPPPSAAPKLVATAQADQKRILAQTLSLTKQSEAQRDREIKEAEYLETVKRQQAQADKAYEIQTNIVQQQVMVEQVKIQTVEREQSILVQDAELQSVERELIATVLKQAEIERRGIETLASAEKQYLISEAEGRAIAIRTQGEAEAAITFLKGEAEAKAMNVKAEAYQ